MKKIIISIITIFFLMSCSSEKVDDNQDSFLKKYNNVVWRESGSSDNVLMKFQNSNSLIVYNSDVGKDSCIEIIFGEHSSSLNGVYNLMEDSDEKLILEAKRTIDNKLEVYQITITAVNDGQNLVWSSTLSWAGNSEWFRTTDKIDC